MNFKKTELVDLHRCYATQHMVIDGKTYFMVATEGEGKALAFDSEDFSNVETIWEGPGGTMSMVNVPGKEGEFVSVQNFFPTFDAKDAILVHSKRNEDGTYTTKKIMDFPYLHRFDILQSEGKLYLLGCMLCRSKKEKEDWSDPGAILVGEIKDFDHPIELKSIQEGLVRNHGYHHSVLNGIERGYVTADQGIFLVTPPHDNEDWKVEKILDERVSDVSVIDIDDDGELELVTIEAFHGDKFNVRKKINGKYEVVYSYPKVINFGHVVWSGVLGGEKVILGGYRREEKELFMLRVKSKNPLTFEEVTIDSGVGPSNVDAAYINGKEYILSANRELGKAAVYEVIK